MLSQANVRRIKAGVSIEELAADIARRTLLQSLNVRPVLDESGAETGMFEVPAGGRRYRALELLVKQKRLARSATIPCVVRTEGLAEEDSLAENVQRAPLHPLDQFRAFVALREKGQSEEEIAAAFFVSVAIVKQRLKLAAVSPKLLDVYAEDGMTLDQLMAFIDNDLVVDADEEVFDMNNGCICCTVRGDPIRILGGLMKRADKLDAIIVETTGLAGPAPVAQTFFVDQDVADRTRLDAIVTVADAVHLDAQLGEHHAAEEQIAFADVVLLNKTDLVDKDGLGRVEDRIRRINPYAKIIRTERCSASLDEVIGLNAFSLDRVLAVEPDFLTSDHDHEHDDDVKSISLVSEVPLDLDKFQTWFGRLLQTRGQDILRSKGILDFKGEAERYVFQGVHMLMDGAPMGAWSKGARQSRLVFIGRNLDTMGLEDGFAACRAA